jgi:hypothetical protein
VRARRGYETIDYGNFVSQDSAERGWFTYDHRPRFGTNYYALRGRVSVLSEAYSHDPFDRRVASTYAFVRELLSLVAERGPRIRMLGVRADSALATWAGRAGAPEIPIRAGMTTTPYLGDVIVETLERTGDTARVQTGVRRGFRRIGSFKTVRMPIYDRFVATMRAPAVWGYVLSPADSSAAALLAVHGVAVDRVRAPCTVEGESFASDSVIVARAPFQNRRNVQIEGRWQRANARLDAGAYVVRIAQPLGVLANEVPIKIIEWAGIRTGFLVGIEPAAAAVIAHLANICARGGVWFGRHVAAIGIQRHANHIGRHHPIVCVDVHLIEPAQCLLRINPGDQHEVTQHHQPLDVVIPPKFEVLRDHMMQAIHWGFPAVKPLRYRTLRPKLV